MNFTEFQQEAAVHECGNLADNETVKPIASNAEPEPLRVRLNSLQSNGYCTVEPVFCIPLSGPRGFCPRSQTFAEEITSRTLDFVLSLCALILSLPVMLVIALIIKLDSPGPALFFQRRLGKSRLVSGKVLCRSDEYEVVSGRVDPEVLYWVPCTFRFVKFRTMHVDAKERFRHLYNYNLSEEEIAAFQFKVENDPRVTRSGKRLRELTVDELPNFWNVLTGEMRLAGPRPELPEMLQNYTPEQMAKFTVAPGISGLAQINGRGNLKFQQTIAYDLEYARIMSIPLDFKIILKTITKVFTKHGAF